MKIREHSIIYTPIPHENRVEDTGLATKGFGDVLESAKVVHEDMEIIGNQESGNECLGKRSMEGNEEKGFGYESLKAKFIFDKIKFQEYEKGLKSILNQRKLEAKNGKVVFKEYLDRVKKIARYGFLETTSQEGVIREGFTSTEFDKNGNGFQNGQQVEVKVYVN